ncbi:MAG: redoxin domain-containing protein [Phycisphaerae bacterium]
MNRSTRVIRLATLSALAACLATLVVPPAAAQNAEEADFLKHAESLLSKAGSPPPSDELREIAQTLADLTVPSEKWKPQERARVLTLQVKAAGALGDAAMALAAARIIADKLRDQPEALELAYVGAVIAADGELARKIAKDAGEKATGAAKQTWSKRRTWAAELGKAAPDIKIRTHAIEEISVTKRGDELLILDFWNVLAPPPKESLAALKKIVEKYGEAHKLAIVSVNADSEARFERAQKWVAENKLDWHQVYEKVAVGAPITHAAFKAQAAPWTVTVDTLGQIRFVGDAASPAFETTLRAALAEAAGEFPPMTADRRSGKADAPATAKKDAENPGEEKALPSNPEAQAKLRQARVFRRTGKSADAKRLLEEIVANYPGTQEAKEAQEDLGYLP